MKYWPVSSGSEFVRSPQLSSLVPVSSLLPLETVSCAEIPSKKRCPWCVSVMFQGHYFMYQSIKSYQMMSYFKGTADTVAEYCSAVSCPNTPNTFQRPLTSDYHLAT